MKAYCINLDRRPDRLAYMEAEFARAAMPFERVAAVDAADPAIAAAAALCPPSFAGPRMSAGAFACLQSHRKAWGLIVDSGAAHGMVFEDDMILAPGINGCLDDGWVPGDADIVRLETFGTRVHVDRRPAARACGRALVRMRSTQVGAGGYVLSAATARRLLAATQATGDPVDEVMFNDRLPLFATLAIYQMVPAPAVQGKRQEGAGGSGADGSGADWVAGSITDRFAPATAARPATAPRRPETPAARIARRLAQEIRARARGTRYAVIAHG